jgi:Ca2+-binding RTX toxin-like protein
LTRPNGATQSSVPKAGSAAQIGRLGEERAAMAFTTTIKGTSGDDELGGADEGDDFIFGYGGNDRLSGFGRHDYLFGGLGDDILDGGDGNDVLDGGPGADDLRGGRGFDYADYGKSGRGVAVSLSAGAGTGHGATAGGDVLSGIEGIFGSPFDDILTGGRGAQSFLGMGGNDMLYGGAAGDTLDGGAGDDFLYGQGGDDLLQGGPGADRIDGGGGFDMAAYYGSPVEVHMSAPQRNSGAAAGDVLIGIEGLYGSDFNDVLVGDAGDNRLNGNGGDDVLNGGPGNDILRGGGQGDRIYGGNGNDAIEGGGLLLDGGPGDDILGLPLGPIAGDYPGQRMRGGEGTDVFHTLPFDSVAVRILDFEPGVDTLRIHLGYGYLPEGSLDPSHFALGTQAADADDRFIYDPASGRLWWDEDGSGSASDPWLIAVLTNHADLSAGDILV